jgi:hypothetical protein
VAASVEKTCRLEEPKLTIQEASAIMGVTPRFLQMALQQDKFPFGVGVKMEKWSFYINAKRFYEYMRMDMSTDKGEPDMEAIAEEIIERILRQIAEMRTDDD